MAHKIAEQSLSDRSSFLAKITELKAILRVPRLYDQYRTKMELLKAAELKKLHALQRFKSENGLDDFDPNDADSLQL